MSSPAPTPTATQSGRTPRRRPLAALCAVLALVGGMVTQPMVAAADPIYLVNSWTYPADLHAPDTTSLGQTIEVPDDGKPYNTVGGRFANYSGAGHGMTLTLKAAGPDGTVLVSETFTALKDNVWVSVESPEPLEPGLYYLEATAPDGQVAWWSTSEDLYTLGQAMLNGDPVAGDRTLMLDAVLPLQPGELRFEGRVARPVAKWDYTADLHGTNTTSLGQSFEVPATAPDIYMVGGRFANYSGEGLGLTLSLRKDGPAGQLVATREVTNLPDNTWLGLKTDSPLEPGVYYLEADQPDGPVAWWSLSSDGYPSGTAFENGQPVPGDRALYLQAAATAPISSPGFIDGVAEGVTFVSDGIVIRRDDGTGFSYDYAPSVIVEGGVQKAWWCGHNAGGDGIYYSESPVVDERWSQPVLVMDANLPWEVIHACDPSVIRGDFSIDGDDWSYLMYYGAADLSGQNTKLGVAFSNNGTEWTKYGDEALLEEPGMIYDYGVGMPGLFTADGQVYVAYFDTGRNSGTIVREVNADGSLGEQLTMLPFSGGDTFADIAFSEAEGLWYLTTKSQLPRNGDADSYIYRSLDANLGTTDWTYLGVVGEYLTDYPLNHNAGWFRNADGTLYEPDGVKRLMFGAQDDATGIWNADAWDLATVRVSGTPTTHAAPQSFALTDPAPDAAIDPLNVNGFRWQPVSGATSYTLRVGTDPSLSSDTLAMATTVHPIADEGLRAAYDSGSSTQRMALEPGLTYYWKVTAVNPAGSADSTSVGSFTTTASYDLDLAGRGYVHWRTLGGATFAPGAPAVLELTEAYGGIRTGADYAPARINLSDMDRVEVHFAEGSDPSAVETLVLSYRLQSESRDTPVHTVSAPIAEAEDGVLIIDMAGQPGWGVADERIAELTIGGGAAGTLRLAGMKVAGPPAVTDTETEPPAMAVLSSTNGWDHGLTDGTFEVRLNLWWGVNASRVKVFENGVWIRSEELTPASPGAQKVTVPVQGKANGTYTYTAQLINSQGSTWTEPLTVTVKDAAPGKPVLSSDNRDQDGNFTVTANLWWGTNATGYTVFENGEAVAEGQLTARTPKAQRVTYEVADKPVGSYEYTVAFSNHAGTTTSAPLTVKVKG